MKKDKKLNNYKTRRGNFMNKAKQIKKNGWIYITANSTDFKLERFKLGMTTEKNPLIRTDKYATGYSDAGKAYNIMKWRAFGPKTMEARIEEHLKPYREGDTREIYTLPVDILIKTIDYYIHKSNIVCKFTNKLRGKINDVECTKISKVSPSDYEEFYYKIFDEYLESGSPTNINDFYLYLDAWY